MRFLRIAILILTLSLWLAPQQCLAGPAEEKAVAAAQKWLSLVDAGKYAEAYEQSAAVIKKAVTKANFATQFDVPRKKVGKVLSRAVKSKQALHNPPGLPPGDYVVIEYNTKFATKGASVERVTPMKDAGGVWRVAGYYITQ